MQSLQGEVSLMFRFNLCNEKASLQLRPAPSLRLSEATANVQTALPTPGADLVSLSDFELLT